MKEILIVWNTKDVVATCRLFHRAQVLTQGHMPLKAWGAYALHVRWSHVAYIYLSFPQTFAPSHRAQVLIWSHVAAPGKQ